MDANSIDGTLIPAGIVPALSDRNSPTISPLNDGELSIRMPPVFRVVSITRLPVSPLRHLARAELFHEQATVTVTWLDHEFDSTVTENSLVSVRWMNNTVSIAGAVRIKRLQSHDRPDPTINLFDTVPHHWTGERDQLRAAAERWSRMPHDMRMRFNALFWDGWRFRQYFADRYILDDRPHAPPTTWQ